MDLLPELLINIIEYLDPEDIRTLRSTCHFFLDICEVAMRKQTLHVNYCRFPTDFMDSDMNFIQRKIQFGNVVDFSIYGQKESDFLTEFCRNFTSLIFKNCEYVTGDVIFDLLPFFPNLKEFQFLGRNYEFSNNFQIKEAIKPILRNLKTFDATNTKIQRSQYEALLREMPNLENLSLTSQTDFKLYDILDDFLQVQASKLKFLQFDYTEIETFEILNRAPASLQLKGLSMGLTDEVEAEFFLAAFLMKQPQLEELKIRKIIKPCSIELVEFIGKTMLNLKTFSLLDSYPALKGLAFMQGLTNLEELIIGNETFMFSNFDRAYHVGFGIEKIYPKLRSLTIMQYAQGICKDCWKKLTRFFPNLRYLNIHDSCMSEESCHEIFKNLNLKSLTLNDCALTEKHLMDGEEKIGISSQKQLRYLSIIGNEVRTIPALPNLRKLIAESSHFGSMQSFSKKLPRLKYASLVFCKLLDIGTMGPQEVSPVTFLNIARRTKGPKIPWDVLCSKFPRLCVLIVSNCDLSIDETYQLFEKLPDLRLIRVKWGRKGIMRFKYKTHMQRRNNYLSKLAAIDLDRLELEQR